MAFETRLTSTDQEQLYLRVPSREGSKVPGSLSVPLPRAAVRGALPGGCCPLPLPPPPGQHSEYSSVDFSHLGGGAGAQGLHNPVLRGFGANTRDAYSGKCFVN